MRRWFELGLGNPSGAQDDWRIRPTPDNWQDAAPAFISMPYKTQLYVTMANAAGLYVQFWKLVPGSGPPPPFQGPNDYVQETALIRGDTALLEGFPPVKFINQTPIYTLAFEKPKHG
jgi:hypothetical protein